MLSRSIFILKILIKPAFAPFAICKVSYLAELAFGHLSYHLTDVLPYSISPSDNVLKVDCPDMKYKT